MKKKREKLLWIALAAVILVATPVVVVGKRYYDARYVLDDYYYTVVPTDYDITPYTDQGGRLTQYDLMCYNADGESRELSFTVLIDTHKSDLYPPGTFIRVSASKQLVIGRRAVDVNDVPEKALDRIKADFSPSAASSPDEYAEERSRSLAAMANGAMTVSCLAEGSTLIYTYLYDAGAKDLAEAAAELLDPVYYVQFRTDKDALPELTAIILEVKLTDGTVIYSQKYETRVLFDYEL